ncbi:atp-dependent peptidase [Phaffia rhodozyma]|uniref:protoporphyrinogen oxidase n=1 Tax=Phaffia rhodozyma TaxID=264483 RepID=A0A0F7SST8_PHARH|nr:atp-dependent peptidase [Phaffia rhodozyma]
MPPVVRPSRVTILGSGLTSLALAHRLTSLSPLTKVTIVDSSETVGGWMKSNLLSLGPDIGGQKVVIEQGPRSVRPKGGLGAVRLLGLVKDLGLDQSIITIPTTHPSAQNRFLLHPSTTLTKLPSSITTALFSTSPITHSLIKSILLEPFRKSLPANEAQSDESVDSLMRRRFGPKVADDVMSGMIHGIYACDSRQLSVRSTFPFLWEAEQTRGSIVKAMFLGLGGNREEVAERRKAKEREEAAWEELGEFGKTFRKGISVWGLKGGLGTLADRLKVVLEKERGVEFLLGHTVNRVDLDGDGVKIQTTSQTIHSPYVISTLPPMKFSQIISSPLPYLDHNPSTTVTVVTLVFPSPKPGERPYYPAGFGYLVPRSNVSNPDGILGCVFDSSAMGQVDERPVAERTVKLTCMIGGPHYSSGRSSVPLDEKEAVRIALNHVRTTLGGAEGETSLPSNLEPVVSFAKTHVGCIPTYLPGHGERMQALGQAIERGPWRGKLALAGAGYGGVSLNDCVNSGMSLAEGLVSNGVDQVTGLERWKDWKTYGRASSMTTGGRIGLRPSHRNYSTLAPAFPSRPCRFSTGRPLRPILISRICLFKRTYSTRLSSPVSPSSSSGSTNSSAYSRRAEFDTSGERVNAPLAARVIVAIIGPLIFFYILYYFTVFLNNTSYFLREVYGMMNKEGVKEFAPAKGDKIITLEDVKGVGEAKDELKEFVEFLKDPEKFSSLGGRPHKGVLLSGPPGTGKTMLARAVATEAGVPFFFASGSEFDDTYVGVGAQRVRELFSTAKERAPAIIFIDELDSIGGNRSESQTDATSGNSSKRQTLNQLLTELDGFSSGNDLIVIAATNFPESLDPAVIRPGRFDRHINVPLPDVQGRLEILKHYLVNIVADPEADLRVIARGTSGLSGADLENLVNQAAVRASKEQETAVRLPHFEWARDRILMGVERKSRFVSAESLIVSAYNEAGHALVALHTPGSVPLHKVSILPRGSKLSVTSQVPGMDQDSISKKEYLARIDVAMAGRVAERLSKGDDATSDRTSEDLQRASNIASAMVKQMGFSDIIGPVSFDRDQAPFLSKRRKDEIESEIKRIVEEGAGRARTILQTHRSSLDLVAKALIKYETLTADEIKGLLKGEPIVRKKEKPKPVAVPVELIKPERSPTVTEGVKSDDAAGGPTTGKATWL